MKRLVRDGRVLYIRRHFRLSILFISISLAIVLYAWLFPSPEKKELGVALYYGIPFALAATIAMLRSQLVAIDRNLGRALFIDRQLFRTHRRFRDLSGISVRLKTIRMRGAGSRHHYIWIDMDQDGSYLFRMVHGETAPQEQAELLAADLGRPLLVEST